MKKFLTMKHWQLFTLLIGIPMILQIIGMSAMVGYGDPTTMLLFFPVMMIICCAVFFGWFYALGVNLHRKLPDIASMSLTRFKVFLIIPIVYLILIPGVLFSVFAESSSGDDFSFAIIPIVLILHLFSMFCIFYCLYFIAKALKAVEWQRTVTFSDFAREFFLIWFFPVGIWIIQPRINKLFEVTVAEHDAD